MSLMRLICGAASSRTPKGCSEDRRIEERLPNEDRAVVAVQVDHQWLILDNRTLAVVRDTATGN
jgi:hypothetical protein